MDRQFAAPNPVSPTLRLGNPARQADDTCRHVEDDISGRDPEWRHCDIVGGKMVP
jgi:hypothetical protein